MNSSRGVVRVRVAAAVAGIALALAGCSMTNPPDVLKVTDPGDGRSGAIGGDNGNGGVQFRNFLLVSDGNGKAGTLVGAIKNEMDQPVNVTLTVLQADSSGQQTPVGTPLQVTVKPSEFVQLGDAAAGTGGSAPTPPPTAGSTGPQPTVGRILSYPIASVPQPAGTVLQLDARTGAGGTTIDLPILPPVGPYAYLSPKAATPTPTSSPTPTASPGSSPSPSVGSSGAGTPTPTATPSPSG